MPHKRTIQQSAFQFILFIGFISLFSDMSYEAARAISGPFLATLGATGAVVGIVAGFGEFAGYALRFLSGWFVDVSKQYWLVVFVGYTVNLLAVPLLAFVGHWEWAAVLIILERMGKGVRTPARDAMLSHAAHDVGVGWGFGIHQALDKVGGMLGPFVVIAVLLFKGDYRDSFLVLFFPALIAIVILVLARKSYPVPQDLEPTTPEFASNKIPTVFWWYLLATALIAAGYADYPLIAFHFEKASVLKPIFIPVYYAIAMGMTALSALVFGRWYDYAGFKIVVIALLISIPFSPFAFFGSFYVAMFGMVLWGIGIGAQHSLVRAVIGNMISKDRRAFAYGIFNAGFGLAWFAGSAAMGVLYDHTVMGLVVFSVGVQLLAMPVLWWVWRKIESPL